MARGSPVPFERMDDDMREIARKGDEAAGGSEWIQTYAHAPEIFKPFVRFYYEYIMTDHPGISLKLTELVASRRCRKKPMSIVNTPRVCLGEATRIDG